MKVIKRSGQSVAVKFDQITTRITNLTKGLVGVDATKIAQKVSSSIYDGISTQEIDSVSAEIAIGMMTENPDYEILAARIIASNIQKTAAKTFSGAMKGLYDKGILDEDVWQTIVFNKTDLNNMINHTFDYRFGYFGLKTLEKSYLMSGETPQYMFMRVAIGIHRDDIERVEETYNYMAGGKFIHATPTLFNAGTKRPQMSSCFLLATKDDSIDGIYDTLKQCANISKWAGGIGLHVHNVRSSGSVIKGTNGISDGIIPMLRVFNATARYVNQAGRRKGSIAVYLEPWHADIMEFLELRLNQGDEEARTRDLFTALWIPDLFMKRVKENGDWSLFCPSVCPGLADVYGKEFDDLYTEYEKSGKARKVVKARDVWTAVLKSQTETGTPYMLYKDACNEKSNQKNIGIIKSSNLCTEIMEHTNPNEVAVCNLASLALPKFIQNGTFDYKALHKAVEVVTCNLNRVIDRNFYPIEEARTSNMRHRPIGIGVQGLADAFIMCGHAFDSKEAAAMNIAIFETIYHAAVTESVRLAEIEGPYETFEGSPFSKGQFQFDMWDSPKFSGLWDWEPLRGKPLRNSLLLAPMPTASTSQILGNNECIEPYTTNIYLRRTLAGEFVVVNRHLVQKLEKLGIWSRELKDKMVRNSGSVQGISEIPKSIQELFKTVWEMKQKVLIDMARDRGCFIDQSQSLNLFMEEPTASKLSSMHMYAWEQGLKTGMYYLRSKAKARPIQVTLEPECKMCSA
jgi:ribonucleoside-diphosphate reductase alpha subunit